MKVTVDLTWDLGKAAGASSLEIAGAETVALLLDLVRARVGPAFDLHVRFAAIAVNGVRATTATCGDG
ncbi:MAG: hypothetical protein HYZ27_10665, partial [Deltaproteobacteria bacterium]|nr:hypothetical protein [Deltaproteobacteria bacterium]